MEILGIEAMNTHARKFVATLKPRSDSQATVVALSGDLGAGKTTFAQGVARALGVEEQVTSPTFVIEKIYQLNQPFDHAQGKQFARLIHIDAYRLNDAHELEVLGWKEIVADPSNLIVIEWPERVTDLIPSDAIHISLEGSSDSRKFTIQS
jgi:tRNA threonylcarbamoyladenosine biosynthesis protein TsaE